MEVGLCVLTPSLPGVLSVISSNINLQLLAICCCTQEWYLGWEKVSLFQRLKCVYLGWEKASHEKCPCQYIIMGSREGSVSVMPQEYVVCCL